MVEKSLEQENALITGASRGIGRAIALGLAAEGVSVAIGHIKNDARAARSEQRVES